jgi:hypothetical protein
MEPSGPNRWQQVANATAPKAAKRAKTVAVGCHRLPEGANGKEVDPLRSERLALTAPQPRAQLCCLDRQQLHYTRTTQALPGGSRS